MAKAKGAPKVMDVVHPSIGRRPSPTSRPVILPDRAYMAIDPMLSTTDISEESTTSPTPDKNSTAELSSAPELTKDTQKTVDLPPSARRIERPELVEPGSLEADSEAPNTTNIPETPEATEPAPNTVPDLTEATPKTSDQVERIAASPPRAAEVEPDQESDDEAPTPETTTGVSGEPLQAQQPQSPDEAALKARQDELERLIAAGTYAVPINTVKRRRARILLIVLVVILVVLIAVDLLADMQIITLPFGLPHTSFLAH